MYQYIPQNQEFVRNCLFVITVHNEKQNSNRNSHRYFTNFVPCQYESKIRHITFEELVNIVRFSSPKYKHKRSVNFTRKINNNDHITHKDVLTSCGICMFWYRFLTFKKDRVQTVTKMSVKLA